MSDTVVLEIIKNANSWIISFGGLLGALAGLLTAAATAWAVLTSRKAKKEVAEQSSTICDLKDEACRAQALAIHATQEMVETREETRKLHEFVTTNVFNEGVLSSMASTGQPPLQPLSDPAPLGKS